MTLTVAKELRELVHRCAHCAMVAPRIPASLRAKINDMFRWADRAVYQYDEVQDFPNGFKAAKRASEITISVLDHPILQEFTDTSDASAISRGLESCLKRLRQLTA